MNLNSRPNVPSEVGLVLRQEACFGCCVCGGAIIDYHHIIPWSEENHFRPEDMMVLCPNHHREIVCYPREEQYKIKWNPYNKSNGFPNGQLVSYGGDLSFLIGTNTFQNCRNIFVSGSKTILGFNIENSGRIGINAEIYTEDGRLALQIIDSYWNDQLGTNWDIISRPNFLQLRKAKRKIIFEIDLGQSPSHIKGDFWYGDIHFVFSPSALQIENPKRNLCIPKITSRNCTYLNAMNVMTLPPTIISNSLYYFKR